MAVRESYYHALEQGPLSVSPVCLSSQSVTQLLGQFRSGASIYEVHTILGFCHPLPLSVRKFGAFLDPPLLLLCGRHIWEPPKIDAPRNEPHAHVIISVVKSKWELPVAVFCALPACVMFKPR